MGTTAALLGYVVLGGIWHLSLVLKYHERKGVPQRPADRQDRSG
jgi:hypothetical protein